MSREQVTEKFVNWRHEKESLQSIQRELAYKGELSEKHLKVGFYIL